MSISVAQDHTGIHIQLDGALFAAKAMIAVRVLRLTENILELQLQTEHGGDS